MFLSEEFVRPSFGRKNRPDLGEFNESSMAGFRKAGHKEKNTVLIEKGVGNWEKHTKGIGAKLLLQVSVLYIQIIFNSIVKFAYQTFLYFRWGFNLAKV